MHGVPSCWPSPASVFVNREGTPPSSSSPSPTFGYSALAGTLLGELELFPDAPLDVILDVRQRLTEPRIFLRAALADATEQIAAAGPHVTDDDIVAFRRKTVDPALAEFNEAAASARRQGDAVSNDL